MRFVWMGASRKAWEQTSSYRMCFIDPLLSARKSECRIEIDPKQLFNINVCCIKMLVRMKSRHMCSQYQLNRVLGECLFNTLLTKIKSKQAQGNIYG